MVARDFETEYLRREIEGKSNIEIVIMLYDAGIKFMTTAIHFIEEKNIEKTHYNITKAQNIITELSNMLDMQQGGQISENLYKLYGFIYDRLINANVKKDVKMINEALEIFSSLREAWVEIAKKDKSGLAEPTPQPVKQEESKSKPENDAKQNNAAKTARNIFKNVTDGKEKPYKPFSTKG